MLQLEIFFPLIHVILLTPPCDSDVTGGILKPTLAGSNQPPGQPEKLVSDDLDSSLANLVGSELRRFVLFCFFLNQSPHL